MVSLKKTCNVAVLTGLFGGKNMCEPRDMLKGGETGLCFDLHVILLIVIEKLPTMYFHGFKSGAPG